MEQLDLFSAPAPIEDDVDGHPGYTYRIDKHGYFVVTAHVDGVGRITVKDRSLWPAVQEVMVRVDEAMIARPDTMF